MNRLFDINLRTAASWTDGEEWSHCNPAQNLDKVYHRIYSASADEPEPIYRLEGGDNFYIGAASNKVRDWTPTGTPWNMDIPAFLGGEFSFYFGLQVGESEIDTIIESHSPWITDLETPLFALYESYHRYYGLKAKNCAPLIQLYASVRGIEVTGGVFSNASLINTAGFQLHDWKLRKLTFIDTTTPVLDIPAGSTNVSAQVIYATGQGDFGIRAGAGHSGLELIGATLINENHRFSETGQLVNAVVVEAGESIVVREIRAQGFSGSGFRFSCVAHVKNLVSDHCGSGLYFEENATARDCMVQWTRQISGDTYAYYARKDMVLNNCGCMLDETGGLGAVVISEGSTVVVNGGDYQLKLPLPFITALGTGTVILNNVTVNGTLYNETIDFLPGESWSGEKAEVTLDAMAVYANSILYQPYMHIPELANAVSVQGSDRPFENVIDLPSGAKIACTPHGSVRYNPADAWLHLDPNDTAIDYFRYSTETQIFTHQFEIRGSQEVSEKLIAPNAFSGTGWTRENWTYSYPSSGSNDLKASFAFETGHVYQISLCIDSRVSGALRPKIGSTEAEYSHSIEGTEVWLIRAPTNANEIRIVSESFRGEISNIFVRKLLRSEAPATPTLEKNGNEIEWYIDPVARLSDNSTPRVRRTGQLNDGARDGYFDDNGGHYLFEDVSSVAKKTAINLRGGSLLEIYRLTVQGGYRGESEAWQTAFHPEMNKGPYFNRIQACYVKADLGLESIQGSYTGQFGNCDIGLFNGIPNPETYAAEAYMLGMDGRNATDGIIDTKKRTEVNHSRFVGAYRQFRIHNVGTGLVANCEFVRTDGTKEAFAPTHAYSLVSIWNNIVDGQRCVSVDQMRQQTNSHHSYAPNIGAVNVYARSMSVVKTYPKINDYCRVAMTDMEFEFSSNGGASWQNLALPNVGLPGVVGAFRRTVPLNSGTYQIRCRCLNGALVGAWSNTISISI